MLYSSSPYGYNNVAYGAPAYGAAYGGVYGAPAYASSFGGPVRASVVGGAPLVGATSFVGGAPLLGGSQYVGGAQYLGGAQYVGGPQLVGGQQLVSGAPLVSSGYVGSPVVYNQAPLATSFVGAPALTSSYVQGGAYGAPLRTSFVASGAPVLGGPVGGFVNSPARYAGVAYDDVSSSDDERWSPIRGSYTRGLRRSFGGAYSAGPYGRYAAPRRSYGGGAPLARYDAYDECGCENINLTSRGAGRLSRLRNNKLF